MGHIDELWSDVLAKIATKMSRPSFETWLAKTDVELVDDDLIVVKAPNIFAADWLNDRYKTLIFDTVKEVAGQTYELEIVPRDGDPYVSEEVVAPVKNPVERKLKGILERLMREADFSVGQAAFLLGVSEKDIWKMKYEMEQESATQESVRNTKRQILKNILEAGLALSDEELLRLTMLEEADLVVVKREIGETASEMVNETE